MAALHRRTPTSRLELRTCSSNWAWMQLGWCWHHFGALPVPAPQYRPQPVQIPKPCMYIDATVPAKKRYSPTSITFIFRLCSSPQGCYFTEWDPLPSVPFCPLLLCLLLLVFSHLLFLEIFLTYAGC